jgi:hypothetical protein
LVGWWWWWWQQQQQQQQQQQYFPLENLLLKYKSLYIKFVDNNV